MLVMRGGQNPFSIRSSSIFRLVVLSQKPEGCEAENTERHQAGAKLASQHKRDA